MNVHSDLSYHFLLFLNGNFNNGVEGGKVMCMIRWGGILRALIVFLSMC